MTEPDTGRDEAERGHRAAEVFHGDVDGLPRALVRVLVLVLRAGCRRAWLVALRLFLLLLRRRRCGVRCRCYYCCWGRVTRHWFHFRLRRRLRRHALHRGRGRSGLLRALAGIPSRGRTTPTPSSSTTTAISADSGRRLGAAAMMPGLEQHGAAAVDALAGDGEEVVLRVQVLVDQVPAPLLRRPALAVAALHEARVLPVSFRLPTRPPGQGVGVFSQVLVMVAFFIMYANCIYGIILKGV